MRASFPLFAALLGVVFSGGCDGPQENLGGPIGKPFEIDPFAKRPTTLIDRAKGVDESSSTAANDPDRAAGVAFNLGKTGVMTIGSEAGLTPSEGIVSDTRGAVDAQNKALDLRLLEVTSVGADYKAHFDRGDDFLRRGMFDQALICFDEAKAIDPKNYAAYVGEAFCFFRKGNYGRSAAAIDFAIRSAPKNMQLYAHRANIRSVLGDRYGAVDDWNLILKEQPEDLNALVSRAALNSQLERYDAAIADYDAAIKLKKDEPGYFINRGVANLKTRRFKAAIEDGTSALALNPRLVDGHFLRAVSYVQMKEPALGRDDYDQAVKLGLDERMANMWRPAFYPPNAPAAPSATAASTVGAAIAPPAGTASEKGAAAKP